MTEPANDPVPPAIRDILALFAGELCDQRFGDLDHAQLDALATETRARAQEVEQARATLDAALDTLAQAREALSTRARQGLAYASVFAASDPELGAKIASLEAASKTAPAKPRAPRRKSAPKKASASANELPFEARVQSGAA